MAHGGGASQGKERLIPFYGHGPGWPYPEFSNFFQGGCDFDFSLPEFARRGGLPVRVRCEFSEKAIMLTKAALMGDGETFEKIALSQDPLECRSLGRKVRDFDDDLWKKHLRATAFEVLRQKFEADDAARVVLLGTGGATLVEAAPRDRIWGVGLGPDDRRVYARAQWRGTNILGFGLMEVREHLRRGLEAADGPPLYTALMEVRGHLRRGFEAADGTPCIQP